ncbi:SDR family oxidoreductase [Neptunicella marina]|uniref:SDR family oxidoreductase n=1 Tax=Neptunicella marina TaxID=2125989 RepID=A0A8J6IWB5_9ALTE|nr:SDR family oxidoreductase [Neptunicella marina]MBC3767429.1 SDR family oxidoreductase [Neptunicella marina]
MFRQNILITGASSGLGREMARQFAQKGHNLALCARRVENLEELKNQLHQQYPDVTVLIKSLDVNQHEQVFTVFREFEQALGKLDRIIVNAGMGKGASIGTGYFEANKQTAVTNFVSALAQCEAALEIFRKQNEGHLVTISSFSAIRGFRRALNVYAASKAALSSLSEGMQVDLIGTPIKVTCIHPGFIRSEINEKVKKVPFMVDTETGVKAMVKAIDKEVAKAFVPAWPWALMRFIMKIAPLSWLAKMS